MLGRAFTLLKIYIKNEIMDNVTQKHKKSQKALLSPFFKEIDILLIFIFNNPIQK